jgi:hypothetical protein
MTQLRPGHSAQSALDAISAAIAELEQVSSVHKAIDGLNVYRRWSNRQARVLGSHVGPSTLEQLITTRRYWTLQALDPGAFGDALRDFVELEVADARMALRGAAEAIERGRNQWSLHGNGDTSMPAAVLDTNVLLQHAESLAEIRWHSHLDLFASTSIALGVPIVVVEELDGLKQHNGKMFVGGREQPTRQLARAALKQVESWFPGGSTVHQLRPDSIPEGTGELVVTLMVDDLDHVRLPDNDGEIIDRALALQSYTSTIALASYDAAIRFRAHYQGLNAFRPSDDD